jgi:branched-chain amino acid aminotransferase
MQESQLIWINGELENWHEAKIHVLTHALHYGTGVFEGIRCFETVDERPAVFRLKEHIARLFDSAKIYMMDLPYSQKEIFDAVKKTIAANDLKECYIRPIAYYGYGEMGVNPLPNEIDIAIAAWRWDTYLGREAEERGVKCQVSSWRRVNSSILPPQAKATANYANGSLAKIEAIKAGYDEAILLNIDNLVAEATGENIFRIKDGVLSTPPASDGALRGITRDTVIQIASDIGMLFRRNSISREELYTSDEIILTGTAAGITPVREVDGRTTGIGKWPYALRIKQAYYDIIHGKNKRYDKWLEIMEPAKVAIRA